jgi:hypothetical protein
MDAPEHVLELAGACVAAVTNALHIELDFTQETLPILDHYISQAKGPREEVLGLIAPMCGAYFGEVVRRTLGPARWHAPRAATAVDTDADDAAGGIDPYPEYRLEFESIFLHFNPIGMALEALVLQPVDGFGSNLGLLARERIAVEKAVELFGDVRDDDYYRLTIRYEVIEQVVETLRSVKNDERPPAFTSDIYAKSIAESSGTVDGDLSD